MTALTGLRSSPQAGGFNDATAGQPGDWRPPRSKDGRLMAAESVTARKLGRQTQQQSGSVKAMKPEASGCSAVGESCRWAHLARLVTE
jgi:hypothetical protein